MFDPKKIAVHFSEQLYAKQVRLVINLMSKDLSPQSYPRAGYYCSKNSQPSELN